MVVALCYLRNWFSDVLYALIESVSASTQSTLEINSFVSLSPLGAPSADLNGIMNTKVTAGAAVDNVAKNDVHRGPMDGGERNEVVQPIVMLPKLEGKDLLKQVQYQLEYYFSTENLSQDPYLISQMDSEQYVPICTIANFNAIKKLTSDINLVVEALKASTLVHVDEKGERVRPIKTRCVVILRDIPEGTPLERIGELFSGPGCPKLMSCKHAAGTSWYTTFDSEEDAQAAYCYLRENQVTFQGHLVQARMKSTTHRVTTFSSQHASNRAAQEQGAPLPSAQQQQVTSPPIDYIPPPQSFVLCAQPAFPSGGHVVVSHAPPPPFITRFEPPSPGVVPTSGQQPSPPVALSAQFSPFVVAPWQPNIYAADVNVMGTFQQQNFKPSQSSQPSAMNATKSPPYSAGHRFTDFHKGVSQRSFNQRKSTSGAQHNNPSTQVNPTAARYVLTSDPNPPSLAPDGFHQPQHFIQTDHRVAQMSGAGAHPSHYLPAVQAPFVTPNANEPHLTMMVPPQPLSAHRRGQVLHHVQHRPSNNYHHQNYVSAQNGNRGNRVNPRTSGNQTEISPRFLNKAMNQQSYGGYGHHGAYSSNRPIASNDVHHDRHFQHHSKAGGGHSDQRSRGSTPYGDKEYGESTGLNDAADYNNNYSKRPIGRTPSNGPASNGSDVNEQRNYQSGLDRRNSRQRRGRREDEKNTPAPHPSVGNTPFNLESNSFPPLPGSSENPQPGKDVQDEDADEQKSNIRTKAPTPESSAPPQKTYSEVSISSKPAPPQPAPPKLSTDGGKPTRVKNDTNEVLASKPVKGKSSHHSSAQASSKSHSKQSPLDKPDPAKSALNSSKPQQSAVHTVHPKKPQRPTGHREGPKGNQPSSKLVESERKAPAQDDKDLEISCKVPDDVKTENDEGESVTSSSPTPDGRRLTYAEMLRKKAQSDAAKSDSGDDSRSSDETRDPSEGKSPDDDSPEAKNKTPEVVEEAPVSQKRPEGMTNGYSRRGDFEHRRGNYRYHRDRNDGHEHRRYDHRDWGYGGGRGNGPRDFRGRGGYRPRRGNFNRYYGNSGGRPVPNGSMGGER
ncbi:uncharacterized protein LOC143468902 isoform X3 [Clavelina lepadiformis]|uniref:uncharacterized protein LOC143468902 isoform X3 n=1 Tax=Clavelina lepadiformis TaxID=159417 RepID=UPI004042A7F2